MNLDFILGSAGQVEFLFSIARSVSLKNRKSSTPYLFESLLFLKVNRQYWDIKTVIQTMSTIRSSSQDEFI